MALGLQDYQFNYVGRWDNLTFGGNVATVPAVDIEEFSGLQDRDVRIGDREFARHDGDIAGLHRGEPRDIHFKLEIRTNVLNQAYYNLINKTRNVFSRISEPSDSFGILTFKMPGEVEKIIRCRPVRSREPHNWKTEYGVLPMEVLLRASDPRIYAVDTDGSTTNNGNDYAFPIINFGNVGSANLTNSSTGDSLEISGAGGAGDLIFDMDRWIRGTSGPIVRKNGTDHYFAWHLPRRPFRLRPGTNSLSGSSHTLIKRHTWQ